MEVFSREFMENICYEKKKLIFLGGREISR